MQQRLFTTARDYFEKALNIYLTSSSDKLSVIAPIYNNIGSLLYYSKNYSEAAEYYKKALDIRLASLGDKHPDVATSYNNLASAIEKLGEGEEGFNYLQKALDIRIALFGENHSIVATTFNNMAINRVYASNYTLAIKYAQKALNIYNNLLGYNNRSSSSLISVIYASYWGLFSQENFDPSLKNEYDNFMKNHIVTAIVQEGGNAAKEGLSGEYYLLEYSDWNICSFSSIRNTVSSYQDKPKDLLLLRDGTISQHHFDGTMGIKIGFRYVDSSERQEIINTYTNWKNSTK